MLKISNSQPPPKSDDADKAVELIAFRARLVEQAHNGDLSAQLEVARLLETGNQFRQDYAMAYFWYKRALDNSGGGKAKTGMDRIFPHLSETDLIAIDVWLEQNHRPY